MGSANDLEQLGLAHGAVFDPARFARDDLGLVLALAIDDFPSYELVTLAPHRDDAWRAHFDDGEPDGRHVRADFVERTILRLFLRTYTEDGAVAA